MSRQIEKEVHHVSVSNTLTQSETGIAIRYSREFDYFIYGIRLYSIACDHVHTLHTAFLTLMDDLISFFPMIFNSYRTHQSLASALSVTRQPIKVF